MANNVVALFDTRDEARQVRDELIHAGFNDQNISIVAQPDASARGTSTSTSRTTQEKSFWEEIKDFFGFGYDEDRSQYEEGIRRGGTCVAVASPDDRIDRAVDIMMSHHPVDLEKRAQEWRAQGWTGYSPSAQASTATSQTRTSQSSMSQASGTSQTAATGASSASTRPSVQAGSTTARSQASQGEQAIPVVEEQIQVGKRQVQQRGVRIYKHTTEKPVEKQVQLREERVTVERRPADRPVTDPNRAFQEQAFEVIETREEPVVSKQARVVEEVVVNRDVNQRTETVRDTVRRTDVDVQPVNQSASTTGDEDFRRLYDSQFANRGTTYEQLRPGFEYGRRIAADQRYRGRDWTAIESDARSDYERTNPGTWDRIKDSVRASYDRARAKV